MTDALAGKVAFITGAGSGLGAAFARRLHADGAAVVVNDVNDVAAKAVADEVDGSVAVFDVTDSAAFDAGIDAAVARHGRLDIVINNAGIAPKMDPSRVEIGMANQIARAEGRIADLQPTGGVTGLSDADWDRMIRTHLYGAFYGTRAALRHMIPARAGNIINISSVLGQQPEAGPVDYSSAKAGIIALTKSASREVAGLGIRINAVCPGYVDTPLLDELGDLVKYAVTLDIGMGRMAKASELAELVRFLAGPESSYCNGDVFTASGAYR